MCSHGDECNTYNIHNIRTIQAHNCLDSAQHSLLTFGLVAMDNRTLRLTFNELCQRRDSALGQTNLILIPLINDRSWSNIDI